jgi:hypothetical protein
MPIIAHRWALYAEVIRRETRRRPRDTPIWKLEAALKCRSCRTPQILAAVHMIRLTREREIVPYVWIPDGSAKRLARRAYVRGARDEATTVAQQLQQLR